MTLDTQTCVVIGASRGIDHGTADGVQERRFEHHRLERFVDSGGSAEIVRSIAGVDPASAAGHALASNDGTEW
jgi:hypothetical protein